MAETHELRLLINAAAAKAGGRQFVAAIRQVQEAVRTLDRDAAGSFKKLATQAEGAANSADRMGRSVKNAGNQAAAGARAASDAFNKQNTSARAVMATQDQIVRRTNDLRAATERLKASLIRSGDTAGVAALDAAMKRFQTSTEGGRVSMARLRTETESVRAVMSGTKAQIAAASTALAQQAAAAQKSATASRAAGDSANQAAGGLRNAGTAATQAARGFQVASTNMRGLENSMHLGFQAASLFRTAIGTITLGTFTSSVFQAGDALQQFAITMEVASGSAEAARSDLDFVNDLAADLGTNLQASRDAFSKFAVSAQIAGVSGDQTREIFESVSTAMAVLGRGTDDQRLAFLALEQMMSKGVISAEELRRQLGERLPGAVSLMARAVGVSTSELQDMLKAGELISAEVLPKFAQELNTVFGSQLERTFNRAGSNLGRLQTEFTRLLEIVANSGFMDTLSREFRDLTTLLRSEDAAEAARRIGEGMATAAEMVGDAVQFIIQNFNEIADVAKAIFGALLVRQFALAATSLTQMGAAATTTAGAYLLFGRNATAMGAAQTGVNQKLTAGAAAMTLMGTASTSAATGVGAAARGLGLLRLGFAALTGPIGILITSLTLLPALFGSVGDNADQVSDEYTAALERMGAASFSFIDRAREVEEATAFEKLSANLSVLDEAEQKIRDFQIGDEIASEIEQAFASIDGNAITSGVQGAVDELRGMVRELQDTETSGERAAEVLAEIKAQIALINSLSSGEEMFGALRNLEYALLPTAQAITLANELQRENTEIAGQNAEAVRENAQAIQLLGEQMLIIAQGGSTDELALFSAELQELLIATQNGQDSIGGLTTVIQNLGSGLSTLGPSTLAIRSNLESLDASFDGSAEGAQRLRNELENARNVLSTAASDTDNLSAAQRESASASLEQADLAIALIDALLSLAGQSDVAAGAQSALAGSVNAAAGSMSSATGAAYDYATALGAVAAAQSAVGAIGTDFREQARLRVELSSLEGRAAAEFRDRHFGTTSRAVQQVDAEIAKLDATLQGLGNSTTGPDGPARYLNEQVTALRTERERLIQDGADATNQIFSNQEAQREARRQSRSGRSGSSGRGGSRSSELTEEAKAYDEASEALDNYILRLNDENEALALVASGRASSVEAAKLLIEAQREGVITSQEQADAFLEQARAAEELNRKMTALANDPVKKWLESVPTWQEAGQIIERDVFQSLSDEIANFIQTGEFSFERLGDAILASVSKIVADKAVKELVNLLGGDENGFGLGNLFGGLFSSQGDPETSDALLGGADGAQAANSMQTAMVTGGQEAANLMRQAMTGGAQETGNQIRTSSQQGATTMGTQVRTAGTSAGVTMGTQINTSGTQGATTMHTQIVSASERGATAMGNAITTASSGSTGGSGIGGTLLGFVPSLLGGLFSEGGMSTQPVATAPVPVTAFRRAPHFNRGTPNTSGIPAILHDNEAVVPLSGNRKIPVEMGDAGRGGQQNVLQQTFNIQTPDADSFRKSSSQIAADAAASGQRALQKNG